MTKKFFTQVSPKAVEGIRRVYERKGAVVHAKIQGDGTAIVAVTMPAPKTRDPRTGRFKRQGELERATA